MTARHRSPADSAQPDRAELGRKAVDDLLAILAILDEAEAKTTANMSSSLVLSRVIREVIGGPEGFADPSLWRRVAALSSDGSTP